MSDFSSVSSFGELGLSDTVQQAVTRLGYESPSPIQARAIPALLGGRDVLGQAQTGTGKTAAFALPLLSRIDPSRCEPQVLVLVPTRELAIQVAEAFQGYAARMKGFHVLPIYGGQDFRIQLRALQRGAQVIVATPGRVMDHMRRGTLSLAGLTALVLDEADEMLRMGFIDDVRWVLDQTPPQRQIALFSATMPVAVRRIAQHYLNDPEEIVIRASTATADTIRQRVWIGKNSHKLEALTRVLEVEPFDAMIIFVRTRTATVELAEKLEARGYPAAALNGDIAQKHREQIVARLKKGRLDIIVATDVAARGLDVERISHVINYDIPHDSEAYVHRIGRTGRAGRKGDAILFVTPRERRMLASIEKATRQKIGPLVPPSAAEINDRRMTAFLQRITDTLADQADGELALYTGLVERYEQEHGVSATQVAAALAKLVQGDTPLLLREEDSPSRAGKVPRRGSRDRVDARGPDSGRKADGKKAAGQQRPDRATAGREGQRRGSPRERLKVSALPEKEMERYRIEVGQVHGVKAGNIVGAIANEAGLDSAFIGRVEIHDSFSTVDLPRGMPRTIFKHLKKSWIAGRRMQISRLDRGAPRQAASHG